MHTHAMFPTATPSIPKFKGRSHAELRAMAALQNDYQALLLETNRALSELQNAQTNFDHLQSPKTIDACIYHIRSTQSYYESLLVQLEQLQDRMKNLASSSD